MSDPWDGLPPHPEQAGAYWLIPPPGGDLLWFWAAKSGVWLSFGTYHHIRPAEMGAWARYGAPCEPPPGMVMDRNWPPPMRNQPTRV